VAVAQPNADRLGDLEQFWKGNALTKAKAFARGPSQMVGRPLNASYVYLVPPRVSLGATPDVLFVTSIEIWTYLGPTESHTEKFKFFYTLSQEGEEWVIVDYAYLDAP